MGSAFAPLTPLPEAQTDLLSTIAWPFTARLRDADWPVWGWVQDQFEEQHPGVSAFQTLSNLPSLRSSYPGSKPYGLIWRSDGNTPEPLQEEAIGLTIMGFAYLGLRTPSLAVAADGLVGVFNDIAQVEKLLRVSPTEVAESEEPLSIFIRDLDHLTTDRPFALPVDAIGRVLQREYDTAIALYKGGEGWMVRLRSNGLRRYRGVHTVEDYIEVIGTIDELTHPEAHAQASLLPPRLHDPGSTGESAWAAIDARVATLVLELDMSRDRDDWQDVGRRSREIMIDAANLIADPSLVPTGTEAPKAGDAKAWLDLYLRADPKHKHEALREMIPKVWNLAQRTTHGTINDVDAFAAAQSAVLIVRTIQRARALG